MNPLPQQVRTEIIKRKLISPGETVLIGVSGGPDSMALLFILNEIKTFLAIKIIAGHINHHLRRSADSDVRYVKKICAKLNIPLFTTEVQIKKTPGKR